MPIRGAQGMEACMSVRFRFSEVYVQGEEEDVRNVIAIM